MSFSFPSCLLTVVLIWLPANAHGEAVRTDSDVATLDRIEVRSSRLEAVSLFDVPASVSVVELEGGPAFTMTDALAGVPGLAARERQNLAQDTQLSIRGFGARSTFGVRGVRLYADGIPATMPDGQGQMSHFNVESTDRIEVMRGPFSALYGNSSGGVVQTWSGVGGPDTTARAWFSAESYGTRAAAARLRGERLHVGYSLSASYLDTEGYRDHSRARREHANLKFRIPLGDAGRLDLVANYFNSPNALDPLGLTRSQVNADRQQATSEAYTFNTRKSARQTQLGALWEQSLGEGHTLRALSYGGTRAIEQILALPVSAQNNPLNSGGLIDLDSDYGGVDLRWSWQGMLMGHSAEVSVGMAADQQRQHRLGFENHANGILGVRGRLRRDERNDIDNIDEYAQLWWEVTPQWALLAGLRHSQVDFTAEDSYIVGSNPDDSGRIRYTQTTPVAGLMFSPSRNVRLYSSFGRGFETPTFNELSYRSDGGAGLAFDIAPATTRNIEVGAKWRRSNGAVLNAAVFVAHTDDEIAVARNVSGRSSYRNVGKARRQGLEIAASTPIGESWQLELAYTRLDATFEDSFPICISTGCTTPTSMVRAGARIPGVARDQMSAALSWKGAAWSLGGRLQGVSDISANDPGTAISPGYFIAQVDVERQFEFRRYSIHTFLRIDNLLDQRYIGSVIVNEGNGRYYEPGPDRTLSVGARWLWKP